MPTTHRLFIEIALGPGVRAGLDRAQANYVLNVLRLGPGDHVLVFNGRDGEWLASVAPEGRKAAALVALSPTRPQPPAPQVEYFFAPLKQARLDYMVQKAVEMGAGVLQPVLTRRTQVSRLNLARIRANIIEAAEQCGILHVPQILPEIMLEKALCSWPEAKTLVFCDENMPQGDPVAALAPYRGSKATAVLIGPEGGFDDAERRAILALPKAVRLPLGPRILRADTAAVAALALVQAILGDTGLAPAGTGLL